MKSQESIDLLLNYINDPEIKNMCKELTEVQVANINEIMKPVFKDQFLTIVTVMLNQNLPLKLVGSDRMS